MHSATTSAGVVLIAVAPTEFSSDAAARDASAARQMASAPSGTGPDAQSSRPSGQKKQPDKAARGLPDSTLYGDLGLVKQKEKRERDIAKAALAQNAAAVAAAASRQALRRGASSTAALAQQLGPPPGPVPAAALDGGAAARQIPRAASLGVGGGAAAPEAGAGPATAEERAGHPARTQAPPRVPLLATAEAAALAAQAHEAAARQSSRLSARGSARAAEVGQQLRHCTRLPALWAKSRQGLLHPASLGGSVPIVHPAGGESTIPLPQPGVSKESSAVLCLLGTAAVDLTLLQAGQQHQPSQLDQKSSFAVLCMHYLAACETQPHRMAAWQQHHPGCSRE